MSEAEVPDWVSGGERERGRERETHTHTNALSIQTTYFFPKIQILIFFSGGSFAGGDKVKILNVTEKCFICFLFLFVCVYMPPSFAPPLSLSLCLWPPPPPAAKQEEEVLGTVKKQLSGPN